jgi:flavin reductase (DIM6/NTAB) family NADH-FMN oxidoreductase RutF
VLISLDRRSRAAGYLAGGRPFTVNVLSKPQRDLALRFAGRPRGHMPRWEPTEPGLAPRLSGTLAWLACAPWRCYDGGDHVLYLGEVRRFERAFTPNAASQVRGDTDPLVFYLGAFRHLGSDYENVPWLGSGDCPDTSWFAA